MKIQTKFFFSKNVLSTSRHLACGGRVGDLPQNIFCVKFTIFAISSILLVFLFLTTLPLILVELKKKVFGLFLWIGLFCLKAAEPLEVES